MKNCIILVLASLQLSLFAQPFVESDWQPFTKNELAEILRNLNQNYQNKNYSFNINYNLYKDHEKKQLVDKNSGFVKKYNKDYVGFNNGVLTLQNSKYKIVVDSTEKIVMISNTDTNYFSLLDYRVEEFMNLVTDVKIKKTNNETRLKIEMDQNYSPLTYIISMNELYMAHWFEIYFNYNPFYDSLSPDLNNKQDKYLMRLEFTFVNLKYKPESNEFGEHKIVQNRGKELQLTNNYSGYELIDLRLQ